MRSPRISSFRSRTTRSCTANARLLKRCRATTGRSSQDCAGFLATGSRIRGKSCSLWAVSSVISLSGTLTTAWTGIWWSSTRCLRRCLRIPRRSISFTSKIHAFGRWISTGAGSSGSTAMTMRTASSRSCAARTIRATSSSVCITSHPRCIRATASACRRRAHTSRCSTRTKRRMAAAASSTRGIS